MVVILEEDILEVMGESRFPDIFVISVGIEIISDQIVHIHEIVIDV